MKLPWRPLSFGIVIVCTVMLSDIGAVAKDTEKTKRHRAQSEVEDLSNRLTPQLTTVQTKTELVEHDLADAKSQVKDLTQQVTSLNSQMKLIQFIGGGIAFVLGVFVAAIITKMVKAP
jgi:hypothetical protein